MKWFTVYVEKPTPKLAAKCTVNSAGQYIAFDGKATGASMLGFTQMLERDCRTVQVFKGKALGKLFARVVNCKLEQVNCTKGDL